MLGLLRGNDEGWGSTLIVSLLAGAGALMTAFLIIETRVKEPMLPLGLFRKHAFTGVQLAAFAVSASMFALFLYLTLYLQGFLGSDPLEAGLSYLPVTRDELLRRGRDRRAPLARAGAVPDQRRPRHHRAGPAPDGRRPRGPRVDRPAAGLLPVGIGVGFINPAVADVAVSVVPKEHSGMASGINDTFRQVGIAIGIAAWGAIFLGRGASKVQEVAAGTPAATGIAAA